jgi:hypothetical protein
LAERRAVARSLVGQRIVQVVYVNIDYRGWDLGFRDQSTRRTMTDEADGATQRGMQARSTTWTSASS